MDVSGGIGGDGVVLFSVLFDRSVICDWEGSCVWRTRSPILQMGFALARRIDLLAASPSA